MMTRTKEETWKAHRENWRRSGKSQRTYAEEQGLSVSSFTRWLRKLSEERDRQPGFIPLRMPKEIRQIRETILIRGTGRVCLEVPLTIDRGRLQELIAVMEASA